LATGFENGSRLRQTHLQPGGFADWGHLYKHVLCNQQDFCKNNELQRCLATAQASM